MSRPGRAPTPEKSTTGRSKATRLRLLRGYFAALAAFAPALAERHALRIFCTPGPRRRHEVRGIAGVEAVPLEVRSGGERLRCWSYGEGPTVLCVHGWGGSAGDLAGVAEALVPAGFRVVVFDFQGHGFSTGRRANLVRLVGALQAVAHEITFSRSGTVQPLHAVVAHSFGVAAATLALREGLLARALVLMAPAAHPRTWTSRRRRWGFRAISGTAWSAV